MFEFQGAQLKLCMLQIRIVIAAPYIHIQCIYICRERERERQTERTRLRRMFLPDGRGETPPAARLSVAMRYLEKARPRRTPKKLT